MRAPGWPPLQTATERLLVLLLQDADTLAWQVKPIGKAALLPDRELYITYDSGNKPLYPITIPMSSTRRGVLYVQADEDELFGMPGGGIVCELTEYAGDRPGYERNVVIDSGTATTAYPGWYCR